jgi:predicted nucleotidyltransferase
VNCTSEAGGEERKPHEESDVDLLVIMRTKNAIDQSIRIKTAFERLFSLDLIVRKIGGQLVE